jgi:hypothetical protein
MFTTFGKTLSIFIALIVILLISSTSIGFFLYNKEYELRKSAQNELEAVKGDRQKLEVQLVDIKKQLAILDDKNKAADEKINSLLDEMELNEGLRNELKKENATLRERIDHTKGDIEEAQNKAKQFQTLLKEEEEKSRQFESKAKELEELKTSLEAKISEMKSDMLPFDQRKTQDQALSGIVPPGGKSRDRIELDKIIINPQDGVKGQVLSVDKEAEFIICNLGLKQGLKSGDTLAVYRGDEYLGDVKATRVQEEMSAADLIPPFSSRKVRKNDSVVFKQ